MQVIEEEAKGGSIVEGEHKEQESLCENQKVISQIQADVHHRALRKPNLDESLPRQVWQLSESFTESRFW